MRVKYYLYMGKSMTLSLIFPIGISLKFLRRNNFFHTLLFSGTGASLMYCCTDVIE